MNEHRTAEFWTRLKIHADPDMVNNGGIKKRQP
jgi:hypothetical protein